MMNWFIQYIPDFVDVHKRPKKIPFETKEDLLNLEIMKKYEKQPDFSHFALEDNRLMGIFEDGFLWWVIGYIDDPLSVDIPQWEGWKFHVQLNDYSLVTLSGDDVISSCGDVLTLRDGSKVKKISHNVSSMANTDG